MSLLFVISSWVFVLHNFTQYIILLDLAVCILKGPLLSTVSSFLNHLSTWNLSSDSFVFGQSPFLKVFLRCSTFWCLSYPQVSFFYPHMSVIFMLNSCFLGCWIYWGFFMIMLFHCLLATCVSDQKCDAILIIFPCKLFLSNLDIGHPSIHLLNILI